MFYQIILDIFQPFSMKVVCGKLGVCFNVSEFQQRGIVTQTPSAPATTCYRHLLPICNPSKGKLLERQCPRETQRYNPFGQLLGCFVAVTIMMCKSGCPKWKGIFNVPVKTQQLVIQLRGFTLKMIAVLQKLSNSLVITKRTHECQRFQKMFFNYLGLNATLMFLIKS